MSRSISPNKITYELNKSSNNISSSFHNSFLSQQDTISNLKLQIFEKGQNRQDYQNLLSRYHILKSDLEKIKKAKYNNERLLNRQENEEKNIIISKLKNENDILFEKINAQIAKNKKLYYENNLLYKEIGMKHCENEDIQDQISQQEKFISKLSYEKDEIEKNIYKLNEEKEKQELNIINFSQEINNLKNDNKDKIILIQNKNGENMNIFKQINEEKKISNDLINEIKTKEKIISENQQKLGKIHNKINLLENDINNLKKSINKNYDKINDTNIDITQEKNTIEKLINDNKELNNLIYNKEIEINHTKEENCHLNKDNIIINQENNNIYEVAMKYRNHLLFLVNQNKNLVSEIQLILGRDEEIKNILQRTEKLKYTLQENKNFMDNGNNTKMEENINDKKTNFNLYQQFDLSRNRKNRDYTQYNLDDKNNSIKIYYNNNKSLKNRNYSAKLENRFKARINAFIDKKENDINKSMNIPNEKEIEENFYNINYNSMEKEPNLEENNISNEFMTRSDK